ncbi:MAG: MBL fold metallo-hydrolase [Candidatus Acetothermia bacterium]
MEIITLATGSTGNAYVVREGEDALLLDAGLTIGKLKEKLWGEGLYATDLDGALITHRHMDHAAAAVDLAKLGVDTLMGEDVGEYLGLDGSMYRPAVPEETTKVGGRWGVKPLPVEHGGVDCLSYLILNEEVGEKLLYVTDTSYFPYRIPGLDYVMVECNWQKEYLDEALENKRISVEHARKSIKTHMSLGTAVDFLRKTDLKKVREVHLIHASETNADPEDCRKTVEAEFGVPTYAAGSLDPVGARSGSGSR